MTTAQHKIGSGFGARSTAEEVLNGIDLSGRLALVTGGYSGLGLETTRALANAGAHVVVPARRPADAEAALAGIPRTEVGELDLADLASVEAFAGRFLGTGRPIDILIASAGIMAAPERRVGPGWESHFAICHLGHHALVNRLWPALKAGGARVVTVASSGHHSSPMRWDDVQFERGYDRWLAYGQAKTANVLFAVHLDKLGAEHGIRAFSLHPGAILTPLQRHLRPEEMVERGWIDEHGNQADPDFKSPEQGAATQVWAATSPRLDGMGGLYCEDCDIAEVAAEEGEWVGVRPYAIDAGEAERLWKFSAGLTGLSSP
ncbi:oxidoreductase [Amycolatopsis sp. MJM2582]|uniref:SDR family NAD(P)-dependent oxidoreductase n=1 Tax=Amycolatopsis sp. MJM2582 TaxID=1427749 RepID=UPI0005020206|nr:SDR family NAD(P)-dependent oxidoreductase [Amycolatopsis sp. MJM2582]KFZ83150.1 oxidoreductase [Amycolatopsis sp. MJM2582]